MTTRFKTLLVLTALLPIAGASAQEKDDAVIIYFVGDLISQNREPIVNERFFGVRGLDYVFYFPGFSKTAGEKYALWNSAGTELVSQSQTFLKYSIPYLFIIAALSGLGVLTFVVRDRVSGRNWLEKWWYGEASEPQSLPTNVAIGIGIGLAAGVGVLWAVTSIDGLLFSPGQLLTNKPNPVLYIDNATDSRVFVALDKDVIGVNGGTYVYIAARSLSGTTEIVTRSMSGDEVERFSVALDPKPGLTYVYNIGAKNGYGAVDAKYKDVF